MQRLTISNHKALLNCSVKSIGSQRAFANQQLKNASLYQRNTMRRQFIVRSSADEDEELDFDEAFEDDYEDYLEEDTGMRLYLDTADVKQWEKWAESGIMYGFTTNPTILKRDGVQCSIPSIRHLTRQAFDFGIEELQLQAWGRTVAEIYSCGLDLFELDSRVVVKLPITMDGLKAARRLVDDGVPVTLTAVYAAHQIPTALAAGASYAAPYLGRMNDAGKNGIEEISKMQSIASLSPGYDGEMRILVASIRSADEIALLAAEGCNTFTISPAVADQLVSDPLTNAAAEVFQEHADEGKNTM